MTASGASGSCSVGLALFGLASLLSAYAQNPGQLIGARALMGIGGAAIMPVTLSIISNVFDPRERGKAIGVWSGAVGLAIAIGPILGGALLEHFWWGSVFLINVPVVIIGLVAVAILVPESRNPRPGRIDIAGVLMSVVGLIGLTYGIIKGGEHGFGNAEVLVTGGWRARDPGGVRLVRVAGRVPIARRPAVQDPPVLGPDRRDRPDVLRVDGRVLLQLVLPATGPGLLAAPDRPAVPAVRRRAADLRAAQPRDGAAVRRQGGHRDRPGPGRRSRWSASSSSTRTTPVWFLLLVFFIQGVGMANIMAPATESIMSSLPREKAGVGSAVSNTIRQVASALGIAILGSILAAVYRGQIEPTTAALPAGPATWPTSRSPARTGVASQAGPAGATWSRRRTTRS